MNAAPDNLLQDPRLLLWLARHVGHSNMAAQWGALAAAAGPQRGQLEPLSAAPRPGRKRDAHALQWPDLGLELLVQDAGEGYTDAKGQPLIGAARWALAEVRAFGPYSGRRSAWTGQLPLGLAWNQSAADVGIKHRLAVISPPCKRDRRMTLEFNGHRLIELSFNAKLDAIEQLYVGHLGTAVPL